MTKYFALLFVVLIFCPKAFADDARCKAPPYGMSDHDFKLFVELFGHIITPARMLPAVCNVKFAGADRSGLYNLGFTDRDIDSKSVGTLASDMVVAMKKLADKVQ
ncbi:hypothetical protein [Bradyrhizobium sp. 188]|uniref:hypothetical protein n=1 Tax=Bradyrhizobium sp. 188 TaxID=2782656 RepID=UPI001FF7531E|nr:hypothetical protein [Bradyrhizobium sp. 188]MCK1496085.1 hypothetical protein [Bradyrhizobium sp. 188]